MDGAPTPDGGSESQDLVAELDSLFDQEEQDQQQPPSTARATEEAASPESPAPSRAASPPAQRSRDGTASPVPGSPAPDTTEPPSFAPPEGAAPFAFHVDGTPVSIDGAVKHGGWIHIPESAWQNQVRFWLGNRQQWREQQGHWQRERQQLQMQRSVQDQAEAAKRQAFAAEIDRISKLPVEEAAQLLDNWRQHWSEHLTRAEAEFWRTQAQQQQQPSAPDPGAVLETIVPQMQDHLGLAVEHFLGQPQYQVLGPKAEALMLEYWEEHADPRGGGRGFYQAEDGKLYLDTDRFERWLTRKAADETRIQEALQANRAAAKRNQAAVAPTRGPGKGLQKPAPQPTARNEKGQFQRPLRDDLEADLLNPNSWFGDEDSELWRTR